MGSPQGAARNTTLRNSHPVICVPGLAVQALHTCARGVTDFILEYADRQIALRQIGRAV